MMAPRRAVVQAPPSVGDLPEEGRPSLLPGGDARDDGRVRTGDGGGPLGSLPGYCPASINTAAASVPGADRLDRLMGSFRVRALLRRHATSPRIAKCGRVVHEDPSVETVVLASGERQARWTGVVTCQRAGCPVCEAARARRLGRAVRRTLPAGGTWAHVTLTVPHKQGETWATVYDRVLTGVRGLTKGRPGRLLREMVEATIRATETTWSVRSGWHVHAHVLWKLQRTLTDDEQLVVRTAWSELTGASVEHGMRFGRVFRAGDGAAAAAYLEKIALEITGSSKRAHAEHWSLGDLYQRAAGGTGVELIQEYQRQTKGRRLYQFDRRAQAIHDAAPELPETVVVERWVTPIERHHFSSLSRAEYGDPLAVYLPLEVAIRARGDPSNDVEDTIFSVILASQGPP